MIADSQRAVDMMVMSEVMEESGDGVLYPTNSVIRLWKLKLEFSAIHTHYNAVLLVN